MEKSINMNISLQEKFCFLLKYEGYESLIGAHITMKRFLLNISMLMSYLFRLVK